MLMRKLTICFLSVIFIVQILIFTVHANAAEPPGLTVIVQSPPDDLVISIRFTGETIQLQEQRRIGETYYRFFYDGRSSRLSFDDSMLVVSSSEKSFETMLPAEIFGLYNNLITLDFETENITIGRTLFRSVLLISMRVLLTLIVEGLIFLLFRYRKKLSWAVFIVVNLITQGALNIMLSGPDLLLSYWLISLVFAEIIIFIFEASVYVRMFKEHTKKRALCYALTANYASFALGWVFLSYLPI
jgi:hypothetical protein